MPLFKINQGSVLVFSLIILSIILSAAITVATVSVTNQRSATATGKSVQSFQVADSGIELALQKIYKGTYTSSDSLATAMTGMTCSGTTLTKSDVAGGNVSLTLFDNSNNPINCSDTSWRDKVVKVKSEGSAFGTTRVVETAVAACGGFGDYSNKSVNTDYTAATDGFVIAWADANTSNREQYLEGLVSGSVVIYAGTHDNIAENSDGPQSFTMPVKRGAVWRVNLTNGSSSMVKIYWVPAGC
jgi:Tfp pilus assembly protein PilX